VDRLDRALAATAVFGLTTNVDFLRRLIALPATREATFYTRLIDDQITELTAASGSVDKEALAVGASFWLMQQRPLASTNPWQAQSMTGWQMNAGGDGLSPIPILHLESRGASAEIRFGALQADGTILVGVDDQRVRVGLVSQHGNLHTAVIDVRHEAVRLLQRGQDIFISSRGKTHALSAIPYLAYVSASAQTSAELRAPMTGSVLKVNVAAGDAVKAGDVVLVMESMKMELRIASEIDGVVASVRCKAGETVDRNSIVAIVEPD
jgi:3-methylcrotonyl-CoA carboxylase alpha subunit